MNTECCTGLSSASLGNRSADTIVDNTGPPSGYMRLPNAWHFGCTEVSLSGAGRSAQEACNMQAAKPAPSWEDRMEFKGLRAQYMALKDRISPAVESALAKAEYILGPEVEELELALARSVGRKHCVTCGNGTDALILSMMLKGIGPGDGVLLPAFTCFAPAAAVLARKAVPILVDIDPDTFNMSPLSLENALARSAAEGCPKPKAVIAIDMFGLPAAFPQIGPIAERYGLAVIEDAAQGFGGAILGKKACSFGELSVTSFYPGKPLCCAGDGGAVFTDSDEQASSLRSIRSFGSSSQDRYVNVRPGVNSRLDTIQAAVLLEKLKAFFEYELPRIARIASTYQDAIGHLIRVPAVAKGFSSSWAQYTLLAESRGQRDELKDHLGRSGVPSVVHYPLPLNLQEAMQGRFVQPVSLVESENAASRALSLPMHAYLEDCDVSGVVDAVSSYFSKR